MNAVSMSSLRCSLGGCVSCNVRHNPFAITSQLLHPRLPHAHTAATKVLSSTFLMVARNNETGKVRANSILLDFLCFVSFF